MDLDIPAMGDLEKSKDIKLALFVHRLTEQVIDIPKLAFGVTGFLEYLVDLRRYRSISKNELVPLLELYPMIHDKRSFHPFDRHYFYQDWWAFEKVVNSKPREHVDIGSNIVYASLLSSVVKVTFLDLRPLKADIPNLKFMQGSILDLPFPDNSVDSLSSLHVVEHIGLGRYSDPLDPDGTRKACRELARVLSPGGNLYVSLPVGHERVCFNAHRIHSPRRLLSYFDDLRLIEFSGINDKVEFLRNADPDVLDECDYGCGLYWFTKN